MDERPPELDRPAVGARDSLLRLLRPHLREWEAMWRAAIPGFTVDSLRFARWTDFHPAADPEPWPVPGYVDNASNQMSDAMQAAALVEPAPGGRYVLLIDRYMMVTGDEIGGVPESVPVLLDRGTGKTRSFEFCGTPCAHHWGAWIDSTRFVLGGWADAASRGGYRFGTLGFYDLALGRKASYLVPVTTAEQSAPYYAAWREWLLERYRRLPRS